MRRIRGSLLIASLLVAAPLALTTTLPAEAQFSVSIGFDSFHGQLAPYGDWLYSDRWGEVWRPLSQDRDPDWRPYWDGHWVFTDEYGWTWISDERPWGEIAYHYGRWVFDPDDGWLWLPGYVWSPAWVVWRTAGTDIGWMPMPPDQDFLRPGFSIGVRFGDWDDLGAYYGYSRWYGFDEARFANLWTFVPDGRLDDRRFRRFAVPRARTADMVRRSRNTTDYAIVNNVIVNRGAGIGVARGPQGGGPRPVHADTVLRDRRWITPVDRGEQIQRRARQERPHGDGMLGSAPPPSRQQVQSLSTRAVPVRSRNNAPANAGGGERARHLFNRDTAAQFTARGQMGAPQTGAPQPGTAAGGRERRDAQPANTNPDNGRPENRPERRGPEPAPPRPPGADRPGRDRGFAPPERETPQATPPAPQEAAPPPQATRPEPPPEERANRPERNDRSGFERSRGPMPPRTPPQASPEPPSPPAQAREPQPPPPQERRGRTEQAPREQAPRQPVMEQPAPPARANPPSREAPQRPAMEQAPPPSPPPSPSQAQPRQERGPDAARPNPPGPPGQDRAGRDQNHRGGRGPGDRGDNDKK